MELGHHWSLSIGEPHESVFPMEEIVDAEWLEKQIKGTSMGQGISKFLEIDIKPALSKGENYASKMIRIKVKVLLKNGNERFISIILKRMIAVPDPSSDFAITMSSLFNSEYDIYANILPHLEKVLLEEDGKENKFWADCYAFIQNKDIYFQDLNDLGYRVGDRKIGLDLDHSELMLQALGRFHAASMVCIDRGLINVTKIRPYFMSLNDENVIKSLSPSFHLISHVMKNDWGPEWKHMADKMSKLPNIIFSQMHESYKFDPSKINVLNHGDFWVSNCMFKYDTRGAPISVRFVDFQICHYNSYAWDLIYFLNTSVDTDLKAQKLDRLISSYCDAFKSCISSLNSQHLPCPTPDHTRQELRRLASAAITTSICVRPVIMCNSEDNVLNPDEIMTENTGADLKKLQLFRNPILTKILKVDLKETLDYINV